MQSEFLFNISLIKHLYDQHMETVVQAYDIKRKELDILLFLANNPGYDTASDIIHRRGIAKSHVSTSVQHLIEKGLIYTDKLEGDKKKIHLHLCPDADAIIQEGREAQKRFYYVLIKDFTKEEVMTLQKLFKKIEHNMQNAGK